MFENLQLPLKQVLCGNVLLITCCGFYLAWWLVAFRIDDPIKGMKSGWLLIPAVIAGMAAIIILVRSIIDIGSEHAVVPNFSFIIGGVLAYVIFAVVTAVFFKRQMTTELLLFVGWGALALALVNTLYGSQQLAPSSSLVLVIIIVAVIAVSLVCYVLFYRLEPLQAYYDGMIPLILVALTMAALSVCMLVSPQVSI